MKFGVQLENFKFKFVDPNFVGDPKYLSSVSVLGTIVKNVNITNYASRAS